MEETEKPFAYSRENHIYKVLTLQEVGQTLADALGTDTTIPISSAKILAWFPSGKQELVNPDVYSKILVIAPSREEALAEVERARIDLEGMVKENTRSGSGVIPTSATPNWYVLGAPLEEQIKAYVDKNKKERRVRLSKEEIEAKVKEQGWA